MDLTFFTRNPTFKKVNKDLPLPRSIKTDKQAILNILHNHHLLVRISWPEFEIRSAMPTANRTRFALRLRSILPAVRRVELINTNDGVCIWEDPEPGVTCRIHWTVSGGQTGYTLKEMYVTRGSRFVWLSSKVYGGHQAATLFLMNFLKKIDREATTDAPDSERRHRNSKKCKGD